MADKTVKIILAAAIIFGLLSCQAVSPAPEQKAPEYNKVPDSAVPYSKGPNGPPGVKGPDSPPPGPGTDTPQAVTEKENATFTLP